jgi:hypothetical protein
MARETMLPLIERLRSLIHDTDDTPAQSDDELQAHLDANRTDVFQEPLTYIPERVNGATVYRVHVSRYSYWELDTLADANGAAVTPDASDLMMGRWEFTAGYEPTLYVTGKVYDLFAAAAAALDVWAMQEALSFDFDADGASYKRSQKQNMLLRMAEQYRRKARPTTAQMRV